MDEVNARLVYLLTDLILPLIVGYLLYQRHLLSDAAVNRLIRINVIVFFTLLSLFSFWALPLTRDLLMLPAFFAFIILFPGFISWRFLGRRFHSPIDRGTHLISALLSNIGTLGGICAYIIYGERGFAYAQIGGACQNLVLVLLAFSQSHSTSICFTRRVDVRRALRGAASSDCSSRGTSSASSASRRDSC